jgi:signal transduction histidine kinase
MAGSSNPAPPPRPRLSVAAAILTCCLAGYAVAVSLLRRSGTMSPRVAAADAVAVVVAVAVVILLWLGWRAGARVRDELTRLERRAGEQDTQLAEQAKRIADQAERTAKQEDLLAQARGRELSLIDERSSLRANLEQSRVANQSLSGQETALREALEQTLGVRMLAAFEGRDVPPADLPDNFDGELAKLLDQLVTEAARAGDRDESVRSALVALSRRVQTAAHRIQEEATLMAERHPGDPDVLDVSMRVDHAAAQQARHAQSMAVLCGEWPGQQWAEPLPLVDVVRAAAGRIIAYRRIEVAGDPDIAAAAPVVEPLIHLVAELLANATQSSPPSTNVPVTVRSVQRGAVIEVHDCGVGLDDHRLSQAREIASGARLVGLDELGEFPQTGLAVVGQYVRRHGFRVDVSESVYGGVRAIVGVPNELVETVAPAEALTVPPTAVPAASEEAAVLGEDGLRPLARRRSPRHGTTGPTAVSATAVAAAADTVRADAIATAGAATNSAASNSASPAGQPSPEQAGAWMNAFLSGDTGADDRTGERDNSAEQEL